MAHACISLKTWKSLEEVTLGSVHDLSVQCEEVTSEFHYGS